LWENLVVHYLLRQVIDHVGQVIEQAHSYRPVWVREKPDNNRGKSRFPFLFRELLPYLHHRCENFGSSASKLDRLEKLGEDLDAKEFFRKVF
jgi:hypothetical protein